MPTDYDPIAEQYKRSKLQPWRLHLEAFTLLGLIGNLSGKSVVDVACGEGFYSRLLRQHGATKVIGVDLSPGMIELARREESARPLGIEYVVGDGRKLQLNSEYDLVVAAYFLNYAATREELVAMCRGVAGCLTLGGRFVTVNCSPSLDFPTAPSFRKYGFETQVAGDFVEGAPITWTFHLDDGPFQIENYYLDRSIHEEAFRSAGFREVHWHSPKLSSDGGDRFPSDYWADFIEQSPIAFIECRR